jgi:hypothetical protein
MKALNIRYLFVSSLKADLPIWATALAQRSSPRRSFSHAMVVERRSRPAMLGWRR